MFDPTLEILVFPTTHEPTLFEVISEDAIQDQYLAWRDASYGCLMMTLGGNRSEVEIEAARRLLLGKDWEVKYSEFYEEAYAYVLEGGETWTRLFKEDLRNERLAMVGAGERELEDLFTGLMDRVDEKRDEAHEREDRAYAPRSAGRFAKAS